jgi:hypothetical protein
VPPHRPDEPIRELEAAIDALVAERQALCSAGASRATLEANRLELGRYQRRLASARIARCASGPGGAQDELKRAVGAGPVLANEVLAA